jgi:hypothetical protein
VRPYLKKNPSQKMTGGVAQGVGPEFSPQYNEIKQNKKQKHKQKVETFIFENCI